MGNTTHPEITIASSTIRSLLLYLVASSAHSLQRLLQFGISSLHRISLRLKKTNLFSQIVFLFSFCLYHIFLVKLFLCFLQSSSVFCEPMSLIRQHRVSYFVFYIVVKQVFVQHVLDRAGHCSFYNRSKLCISLQLE